MRRRKPKKRSTKVFRLSGAPVMWRAWCQCFGPGHEAKVAAETAKVARRKGAQALGVHLSAVNVELVG